MRLSRAGAPGPTPRRVRIDGRLLQDWGRSSRSRPARMDALADIPSEGYEFTSLALLRH